MEYKVNEIFTSIKGEGEWLGTPMNFVRLAGCNLSCEKCDTTYNEPIIRLTPQQILDRLNPDIDYVVVTGGEPTMQNLKPLLRALRDSQYQIHLESNGTYDFSGDLFDWVCISPKLDYEAPLAASIFLADEIKMPIRDAKDLKRAEAFRSEYKGKTQPRVVWYLLPWNDRFEQPKHGKLNSAGSRTLEGYNKDANRLCIQYAIETGRWKVALQAHKVWQIL